MAGNLQMGGLGYDMGHPVGSRRYSGIHQQFSIFTSTYFTNLASHFILHYYTSFYISFYITLHMEAPQTITMPDLQGAMLKREKKMTKFYDK